MVKCLSDYSIETEWLKGKSNSIWYSYFLADLIYKDYFKQRHYKENKDFFKVSQLLEVYSVP